MPRPLEVGERVLIVSDGDIPDSLLPIEGRVFYIDEEIHEIWITNLSDAPSLDCVIPEEDDDTYVLNYSGDVWRQTERGRTRVIRYSEKDNIGTEHLKGIAKFLRRVEAKHATV